MKGWKPEKHCKQRELLRHSNEIKQSLILDFRTHLTDVHRKSKGELSGNPRMMKGEIEKLAKTYGAPDPEPPPPDSQGVLEVTNETISSHVLYVWSEQWEKEEQFTIAAARVTKISVPVGRVSWSLRHERPRYGTIRSPSSAVKVPIQNLPIIVRG